MRDERRGPAGQPTIRIVVVEPYPVIREGIMALLEENGVTVVGSASSLADGFPLAAGNGADLILTEVTPTIEATVTAIRDATASPVRVVVLSQFRSVDQVRLLLDAGAHGLVSKHGPTEELFEAVRAMPDGRRYVCAEVTYLLAGAPPPPSGAPSDIVPELTAREREVLRLIADGKSDREIAAALELSVKTVETHRTKLRSKLRVHKTTLLVRRARELGLLD